MGNGIAKYKIVNASVYTGPHILTCTGYIDDNNNIKNFIQVKIKNSIYTIMFTSEEIILMSDKEISLNQLDELFEKMYTHANSNPIDIYYNNSHLIPHLTIAKTFAYYLPKYNSTTKFSSTFEKETKMISSYGIKYIWRSFVSRTNSLLSISNASITVSYDDGFFILQLHDVKAFIHTIKIGENTVLYDVCTIEHPIIGRTYPAEIYIKKILRILHGKMRSVQSHIIDILEKCDNEQDIDKYFTIEKNNTIALIKLTLKTDVNKEEIYPVLENEGIPVQIDVSMLQCAICYEMYKHPVITSTAQTYCKKCIDDWLKINDTCPITRIKMIDKKLIRNYAIEQIIRNIKTS